MTAHAAGPSPTVPRVLVLGLGNDLLRDDAIGLRLAEAIRHRLAHRPDITVLQTTEMGLALLDMVSGYDELILVDAVMTGHAAPGCVHALEVDQLALLPNGSPHFLGIGEMLALGRELGIAVPRRTRIFAVEVEDPYTLDQDLTPAMAMAFSGLVQQLERVVAA